MSRRKAKLPPVYIKILSDSGVLAATEPFEGSVKYVQSTGAQMDKSGSNPDVRTPREFILAVIRAYGPMDVDLAAKAGAQIHGSTLYITPEVDSLKQPWADIVNASDSGAGWCNPPYDKIASWVAKAAHEAPRLLDGRSFRLLLPASVGAAYWREHVDGKAFEQQVGRIAFEGYASGSMKDHCLLHYGNATTVAAWSNQEDLLTGEGDALERYWDWKAELTEDELASYNARIRKGKP